MLRQDLNRPDLMCSQNRCESLQLQKASVLLPKLALMHWPVRSCLIKGQIWCVMLACLCDVCFTAISVMSQLLTQEHVPPNAALWADLLLHQRQQRKRERCSWALRKNNGEDPLTAAIAAILIDLNVWQQNHCMLQRRYINSLHNHLLFKQEAAFLAVYILLRYLKTLQTGGNVLSGVQSQPFTKHFR